jgi:hypothetical protein
MAAWHLGHYGLPLHTDGTLEVLLQGSHLRSRAIRLGHRFVCFLALHLDALLQNTITSLRVAQLAFARHHPLSQRGQPLPQLIHLLLHRLLHHLHLLPVLLPVLLCLLLRLLCIPRQLLHQLLHQLPVLLRILRQLLQLLQPLTASLCQLFR